MLADGVSHSEWQDFGFRAQRDHCSERAEPHLYVDLSHAHRCHSGFFAGDFYCVEVQGQSQRDVQARLG